MDERDLRTRTRRFRDRGLSAAGGVGGAALARCRPRRSRSDRRGRDHLGAAERKGEAMQRSFHVLLPLVALASPATISAATAQQKPYNPGLGDLMTATVQPRHIKLGLAAREGNWPYAAYELHELKEAFDRAAQTWPKWRTFSISEMMALVTKEPMAALERAIKAGDPNRATAAFDQLTAACNTCHRSADRGMIVIQSPLASAFP